MLMLMQVLYTLTAPHASRDTEAHGSDGLRTAPRPLLQVIVGVLKFGCDPPGDPVTLLLQLTQVLVEVSG